MNAVGFGDVSFSTTVVHRLAAADYDRVARRLGEWAGLDAISPSAAADFEATEGAVPTDLRDAAMSRHAVPLRVAREPGRLWDGVDEDLTVFVSRSPVHRTVAVTVNLYLPETTPDQLVALAHSTYGAGVGDKPRPIASVTIEGVDGGRAVASLREIHTAVADHLTISASRGTAYQFRCVEIRRLGAVSEAATAFADHPAALYGVLVADEGWRHVARETAAARLAERWGTRSFASVVCLGDTCLVLNFRPAGYAGAQSSYFRTYFDRVEPYFTRTYRLAGVEHGPFFALELCAYRTCLVDDLQRQLDDRRVMPFSVSLLGGIKQRQRRESLHRTLVEGMERLRARTPVELGSLVAVVETGSGLPARVESLRQEVQAYETEEQTRYLYSVNRLVVAVAWIGVFVAVVGLAIAGILAS